MAKRSDSIDGLVETLKPIDDERLASLSHKPAAQALYEEVTSMSSPTAAETPRRGRHRLVWQGALVAGAVVIVLAVLSTVNVFGADGPSIVDKAAAAVDPRENAIVHVKITGSESGKGGYISTWTEESWALTSSPYTRRDIQAFDGSPAVETVQNSEGLSQAYVAGTNTIYQPPQKVGFRVEGGQASPYRDMILELLTSGEAVMEGAETVNGRECVVIAATKEYGNAPDGTPYGTWYVVDAKTYDPVEWRMTRDGGKAVTMRFEVYEQLPADEEGLALLDLAAQHPGAAFNTSLDDYQDAMEIPQADPGPAKGTKE
ncbi:MAG TPA: hypothetical protein VJP78_10725 [Thermoleophilia bacterium]|nr:hypothetical protein [Thermoleophilia bacterium]